MSLPRARQIAAETHARAARSQHWCQGCGNTLAHYDKDSDQYLCVKCWADVIELRIRHGVVGDNFSWVLAALKAGIKDNPKAGGRK